MIARPALALTYNRHLLAMVLLVLIVAGASSLSSLPVTEDPRIVMRGPIVLTRVPGASPERVEALVSEKIEEKLQEVSAIREIDSSSRAGISVVSITLHDRIYDNEEVFAEIRDQVAAAVPLLPPEAQTPVFDDKRGATAFSLVVAVTVEEQTQLGIASRLAEVLADRLRGLPGTELVRLYGEPEEELVARLDDAELAALGLRAGDVAAAIRAGDAKTPSGRLRSSESDIVLEVQGALDSVDRVRQIPLRRTRDGAVVRVSDVAEVRRGWREPTREIGLADGSRAIFVAARMGPEQRATAWAQRAQQVVEGFETELGSGRGPIGLRIVFDQSGYTADRLGSLTENLLLGALVVVAVVLFSMGLRSGLVVGAALPLTFCLALFGLLLSGGTLQQMSIFGMTMALGLLIDNAIVVVDEVGARLHRGATRAQAVEGTVSHLFGPLLASTLTTVLAFAPIPLLIGNVGDFVGPIGVSVILALVASFGLSMTLVPALAGLLVKPASGTGRWSEQGLQLPRLARACRRLLRAGLRRPLRALAVAVALPLLGFLLAPTLGSQFFPRVDRNMFDVQVWLPRDAALERTRQVVERLEARMRNHPEVRGVSWLIGGSFPSVFYNLVMNRDDASYYARGVVETGSAAQVKALLPLLQAEIDAAAPDAQALVRQFGQGPPVDAEVELELRGSNLGLLQELGETLRQVLARHPEVLHTQATLERGEPKLWVEVNEDEARLAGLSLRDVAGQLEGQLEGRTGGSLIESFEELPVRIRTGDGRRADREGLADTQLLTPGGGEGDWLPLSALGGLELRPEIGGITRCDGERCNRVRAYLRPGALPIDVSRAVIADLEGQGFRLPPGTSLRLGGDSEEQATAVASLLTYAPVLGVLMLATLVLCFRSALLAGLLFAVAGLSVGVGLLATWLAGFPFSFNGILGTAGLIGVALNDSIVVLSAIRDDDGAAAGDVDAIADAVLGCGRHVLSTTLTTIGGFLPLLVFVGGDFWPPLAIVLVGGVAGATLLATVFVPAGYCLIAARTRRSRVLPLESVVSPS